MVFTKDFLVALDLGTLANCLHVCDAVRAVVDLVLCQQLLSTSSNAFKQDREIGALSAFQLDAPQKHEKAARSRHSYS